MHILAKLSFSIIITITKIFETMYLLTTNSQSNVLLIDLRTDCKDSYLIIKISLVSYFFKCLIKRSETSTSTSTSHRSETILHCKQLTYKNIIQLLVRFLRQLITFKEQFSYFFCYFYFISIKTIQNCK